jgi:hypothetical protein
MPRLVAHSKYYLQKLSINALYSRYRYYNQISTPLLLGLTLCHLAKLVSELVRPLSWTLAPSGYLQESKTVYFSQLALKGSEQ